MSAYIISRLDCGNATLSGLPQSTLAPRRVLNAAARLVSDLRPRKDVTSALIDLHFFQGGQQCWALWAFLAACPCMSFTDIISLFINWANKDACLLTMASCCCTYRIQDMRANLPVMDSTAPAYISDMLQPVSSLQRQTNLHSATNSELFVPRTRLRIGERAFSSASPRLWNALWNDQASCHSTNIYKETRDLSFLKTSMLILLYFIILF